MTEPITVPPPTVDPGTLAPSTTIASGPSGTSRSSTPWSADQQQVIDGYRAFDVADREAAATSDQNYAGLAAHADGDYLLNEKASMFQRKSAGLAVRRGDPSLNEIIPLDVKIVGSGAVIVSCDVNNDVVFRTADGSVVNADTSTDRFQTQVSLRDGSWKVISRQQVQTWAGSEESKCVAAPV